MRWVVVGGGAAGCVVAARLSERSDADVVLLEAGPDHGAATDERDVGPFLDDPARVAADDVVRRDGAAPERYLRGTGLGGSSLINGTVVTAPQPTAGHRLPLELPWADGAVGRALLAADRSARRVRLIRRAQRRVTAADAYLRPVAGRSNLVVRTGAAVHHVVFEGRRLAAVVTTDGSTIDADRVVLCAGAIWTPTILLRSGVDTPGVGEGLEDHPTFTITLQLTADAIDATAPTISAVADHGDCQVLALNRLPEAPALGALVVGVVSVRSTGTVRLPDTDGPPVVEMRQLAHPDEVDALVRGVAGAIELLDDPAWDGVVEQAYVDAEGTRLTDVEGSRSKLREWIIDYAGGHYHASGTCREGVVSERGAVHGYEGLHVADASVLPGVPRDDPYLAVVATAERLVRAWT